MLELQVYSELLTRASKAGRSFGYNEAKANCDKLLLKQKNDMMKFMLQELSNFRAGMLRELNADKFTTFVKKMI